MNATRRQLIRGIALAILLSVAYTASAFYDPTIGRWITRDPIGEPGFVITSNLRKKSQNRDELNSYSFVAQNPISETDYLGLFLGFGYGNYCGWSKRGPGQPIDDVDAACELHDKCIPQWRDCWKAKTCNDNFCAFVKAANCSKSPDPSACSSAKAQILTACLGLGSWTWILLEFYE